MKSIEESFEALASEMAQPPSASKSAVRREASPAPEPVREDADSARQQDEPGPEPEPEHPEETPAQAEPEDVREGPINPRLVCLLQPRSADAEDYYRLRYKIETRRRSDAALVVGVTSASEGEGKTLTAINLAGALAKDTGTQVLLLDLDLRHRPAGGVSEYLGMRAQDGEGAVDWIRETEYGYEQFVHYLHPYNLHVMTAGSEPELPYELLKSTRLDQLIRRARRDYDFVVIDTPQILRLPDTELIARVVDGFVVVVKANVTKQERLEEALNLMRPDKVFGMVFNADTEKR
ncbi:MAG: AAA family ATPase [Xanthomonadales bacterium]|jgi:capsular exopolysaccharide synthesis family protein|nr:AAA family ATPase [Xanthomonadales bacterium]